MKVVIAGGTGQVGRILERALTKAGASIVTLSRKTASSEERSVVPWDGRTFGRWADEIDGSDVVINLAGKSVDCRYHARNRGEILRSRVDSTRVIGEAIRHAKRPPQAWLQASTATIYAHRFDAANDEQTGILGGSEPDAPDTWRFSIEVAKAWEAAATEAAEALPATRLVILRSAITMSPDRGGAFDTLLRLTRFGLGGRMGDGRQYVSWIHEDDFSNAIHWLIEHHEFRGAVNLAAPVPLSNTDFMRELREAWGIRARMPAPDWLLEVGAWFLRTETELILKSRRVVPGRLLSEGFRFKFPEWRVAAADLCGRWRNAQKTHSLR